MICGLAISLEQDTRKCVEKLSYRLQCQRCGLILYRTQYSAEKCPNCRRIVQSKLKYLFGFQPARFRYYNDRLFNTKQTTKEIVSD